MLKYLSIMDIHKCKPDGNADVCPVTKEAWEARAEKIKCGYENEYHCLSDIEGRKWEKCLEKTLILEGNCPIITSDGYLDWKSCNISDPPCPKNPYASNEVYKYSWCFGNNAPENPGSEDCQEDSGLNSSSVGLTIGLVVLNLFIIGSAILVFMFIRRRRKMKRLYFEKIPLLPIHNRNLEEKPDFHIVGFARRQIVHESVSALLKKEVKSIAVVGHVGNSVSFTSRLILEKYTKTRNWKSKQYLYSDVPNDIDVHVQEKTIIFVYGWFGLWNDDLCSLDTVKMVCKTLKEMMVNKDKIKLIISMGTAVYGKYRDELERCGYLKLIDDVVHLDSTSVRNENTCYLEKVQSACKDSTCPCKSFTTEKLREGNNISLGMPLKINFIVHHHDPDLLSKYLEQCDVLLVMKDHIKNLKEENRKVYDWIVYICMKGQFVRSELDHDLELLKSIGLSSSSFDEKEVQHSLFRYLKISDMNQEHEVEAKDVKYVFWHRFIYICAFHALCETQKNFVMEHCNVDAILQLVRPKNSKPSYMEVPAEDNEIGQFVQRLKRSGPLEKYENHPLVKRHQMNLEQFDRKSPTGKEASNKFRTVRKSPTGKEASNESDEN